MGRNNGTYEMDTAPSEIDALKQLSLIGVREHGKLLARVEGLEVTVEELVKVVEKLRKKHNKKLEAKPTAEDEMWARRRREDVQADPGAAY